MTRSVSQFAAWIKIDNKNGAKKMTLILTELTPAGIAMAADSAITKIHQGKIIEIDQQGMTKIIRVPKIRAAVSFWGMIGAVTNIAFNSTLSH